MHGTDTNDPTLWNTDGSFRAAEQGLSHFYFSLPVLFISGRSADANDMTVEPNTNGE